MNERYHVTYSTRVYLIIGKSPTQQLSPSENDESLCEVDATFVGLPDLRRIPKS